MELNPEEVHYEFERMFYWARVQVTTEDGKKSVALIGAGKNYLWDHFAIPPTGELTDAHVSKWLDEALIELETDLADIPYIEVYYKAYANSPEGHANGLKFLQEEITP